MALWLKQSTASQEILLGRFVDATDGNTAETALSIANTDIKLWKEGATTLADKNSGGATHISGGLYYAVLDATDTDTLGKLEVHVQVSGALSVRREFMVLPANVFDSLVGSDKLEVDVTQFGGTNATASGGRPEVNTSHIAGSAVSTSSAQIGVNVVNAGGTAWGSGAITAASIATGAIDADAIAADAITAAKIADGAIDAATFAANAITSTVLANDAITAAKVAADVTTEIQSGLATQASVDTIDDFLDTEIAAIKAKTDSLTFTTANRVDASVRDIGGAANAATALARSAASIVRGTIGGGSSTTSLVASSLSPASAVNDQFNGRIIIFAEDTTTTALRGQATDITDYVHGTTTFTVTALTTAPSSGDTFSIV